MLCVCRHRQTATTRDRRTIVADLCRLYIHARELYAFIILRAHTHTRFNVSHFKQPPKCGRNTAKNIRSHTRAHTHTHTCARHLSIILLFRTFACRRAHSLGLCRRDARNILCSIHYFLNILKSVRVPQTHLKCSLWASRTYIKRRAASVQRDDAHTHEAHSLSTQSASSTLSPCALLQANVGGWNIFRHACICDRCAFFCVLVCVCVFIYGDDATLNLLEIG